MLALLKGQVHYRGNGYLILEQGGMGHKIVMPEHAVQDVSDETVLYIHEVVRDSERELFGFQDISSLEFFWKLIGVSGLGPKSAQKIVFSGPLEATRASIMGGDLTFLTNIPGIGNKTAQKIILELKGVLAEEPGDVVSLDTDAFEALLGLGYTKKQAEQTLQSLDDGLATTDDRIRAALKVLAR